jgi:hypothetical protein
MNMTVIPPRTPISGVPVSLEVDRDERGKTTDHDHGKETHGSGNDEDQSLSGCVMPSSNCFLIWPASRSKRCTRKLK